jgi:ParB family chromosome partitioning protein
MTKCLDIPLDKIEVPTDRARHFDPVWADGLARSIEAQGLLHPIRVRVVDNSYRLVAGLIRLEAHRILGRAMIAAFISTAPSDDAARLEEVMENLGRQELIALDRCHHLFELKQVWERMHPETKHGATPGNQHTGKGRNTALTKITSEDMPAVFGFVAETASKIGLGKTQIKEAVKIWSQLVPAVRVRLAGCDLAKKQTELKALSDLPAPMQVKVLDLILGDEHPISSVSEALDYVDNGVVFDDVERKFVAANKVFGKLADSVLDRLIVANEERIVASLKRQGRI